MWASSKPEGTTRKLMNEVSMKNVVWRASISRDEGKENNYNWLLRNTQHDKNVKI